MKTLIFTLITLSFAFSHAGRVDNYYRGLASEAKTLKTKEEIADYLNSLSKEELVELHHLRHEAYVTSAQMIAFIGNATLLVGSAGWIGAYELSKKTKSERAKTILKRVSRVSGGVMVLGFLTAIYGTYKPTFHDSPLRENIKDYINSLTLEEAREFLSDMKKINEELKKEAE